MDNKITKNRLSNFLAYEWIIMIVVAIGVCIVWGFVFTVSGVSLTAGQQFKVYYDETISSTGATLFQKRIYDDNALSYDVLKNDWEKLTSDYNVLSIRLSIQEGDMIFTDSKVTYNGEDDTVGHALSKKNVDSINVYTLDKLLEDSKGYLKTFLKDGEDGSDLSYEKMDQAKIKAHFLKRMEKDNRFRKPKEKAAGVKLECERIERLCKEVKDFEKLLNYGDDELFYRYTKYEQVYNTTSDKKDKAAYEKLYQREIELGRENARYGINIAKLPTAQGKINPSEYAKKADGSASDVVLMTFDFKSYQPDLQYEAISVINTFVRACSNILD